MTLPIHTVKHVRAEYRKYQVLAITFAAITLITALLAAITGIQLAKLRKKTMAIQNQAPNPSPANAALIKEIDQLKSEIQAEKSKSEIGRAHV